MVLLLTAAAAVAQHRCRWQVERGGGVRVVSLTSDASRAQRLTATPCFSRRAAITVAAAAAVTLRTPGAFGYGDEGQRQGSLGYVDDLGMKSYSQVQRALTPHGSI